VSFGLPLPSKFSFGKGEADGTSIHKKTFNTAPLGRFSSYIGCSLRAGVAGSQRGALPTEGGAYGGIHTAAL
jgi:hypothetical protein